MPHEAHTHTSTKKVFDSIVRSKTMNKAKEMSEDVGRNTSELGSVLFSNDF